jgi:pentatricopeptide repeat protein
MYNLLMTAYKKARQWQHVVQVMQQMQASGVPADIVSCGGASNRLVSQRRITARMPSQGPGSAPA